MTNSYTNTRIEFHILQSFPVTCLNRDDVGAPKTAIVGGANRARVSSQCWKRQVRLTLKDFGIKLATRTKFVERLFTKACLEAGADEATAQSCGEKMATLIPITSPFMLTSGPPLLPGLIAASDWIRTL